MQIPSAEFIEAAIERVKKLSENEKIDELKELKAALGGSELVELGVTIPLSSDVQVGYLLGLETARETVETSPEVLTKGIDPKQIL